MAGLPNFSTENRARLKALGVVDAQIEQLRYACLTVSLFVSRPAARNDVAGLLDDLGKLADKLLRKAEAIERKATAAHALAHALLEQGYWSACPDDRGGTSFHCVAPRLTALRDAARAGKQQLPRSPSRPRSANPRPVRAISDALLYGWTKEYGSNVYSVRYEGGEEIRTYRNGPQRKPYPAALGASAADGSAFRAIVGICYETVGGNPDPLAAIRSYLKAERERRKKAIAALDAGIAAANRSENRTSRKR